MARLEARVKIEEERQRFIKIEYHASQIVIINNLIYESFIQEELISLVLEFRDSFSPRLDYENLSGQTRGEKIQSLTGKFERHNLLYLLVERCRELRSHLPWPQLDPPTIGE